MILAHQTAQENESSALNVISKLTIDGDARRQDTFLLGDEDDVLIFKKQKFSREGKQKKSNTLMNSSVTNDNFNWLSDVQTKLARRPDIFNSEEAQFPRIGMVKNGTCAYKSFPPSKRNEQTIKYFSDLEYAAKESK